MNIQVAFILFRFLVRIVKFEPHSLIFQDEFCSSQWKVYVLFYISTQIQRKSDREAFDQSNEAHTAANKTNKYLRRNRK